MTFNGVSVGPSSSTRCCEAPTRPFCILQASRVLGIAFLPKWLIGRDLEDGRLEQVLPGTNSFAGRLFALYPSRKYLSAKVRTFLDFIAQDPRLK